MRTVYYSLGSVRNLRIEQKNKALRREKGIGLIRTEAPLFG